MRSHLYERVKLSSGLMSPDYKAAKLRPIARRLAAVTIAPTYTTASIHS